MNLKLTSTLFALALGSAAAPMLQAQDQATTTAPAEGKRGKGPRGGKGAEGRGPGGMNPAARVEQLDRRLTLTADQKTKLTEIYTKAQDEMQADMKNAKGGGDRTAAKGKMQQSMQATRDQVAAVLTAEQKKKFEEMDQGQRGRPKGGRGPGGGKRKPDGTN